MGERNEGIERDVQRFLERKRIEHEVIIPLNEPMFDV